MDVIALAQYGLPIGIATCWTSLTPDHIKLIRRHAETIYLAFDNDSAWFDATMRAMKLCYASDIFPKIITLPEGSKDIDEYLHTYWWEEVFEKVKWLATDGRIEIANRLKTRYDLGNPVLRKKALHLFFELLHAIKDYTIFTMYMDQLSTLFKTDGRLMLKQYKQFLQKDPTWRNLWRRRQEEESTSTHPTETQLIQAWLVDEFFEAHVEYTMIESLLMQCLELDSYQKIQQFNPEQFENDSEQSKETQLRREHQREGTSIEQRTATVIRILQKRLNTTKRQVLKRSDLSGEQKQEVLRIGR
jgi:DNA primase